MYKNCPESHIFAVQDRKCVFQGNIFNVCEKNKIDIIDIMRKKCYNVFNAFFIAMYERKCDFENKYNHIKYEMRD